MESIFPCPMLLIEIEVLALRSSCSSVLLNLRIGMSKVLSRASCSPWTSAYLLDVAVVLHAASLECRRQQEPASTITQNNFRRNVIPSIRNAKFGKLQDWQRYAAIKDLPLWVKTQEISPYVRPLDVMLLCLHSEEKFTLSNTTSQTAPNKLPSVLRSMGFESVFSCVLKHRSDSLKDIIPQAMETLQLNRVRQPLPPSGLVETTFYLPGPVTQNYAVINQPIPQALIDAAPKLKTRDNLCVRAHMDVFFDVKFRNRISANSWYRFRVVDTTLLPWDPKSEKMSDANPQILHNDHYFQ
jgi:uncharacterized protein YceK